MIDRYCLEEMKKIWSDKNKISLWLDYEISVIKVFYKNNVLTKETYDKILDCFSFLKLTIDDFILDVVEKEKQTKHDVAAFVDVLSDFIDSCGIDSRWVHFGLTSSDVLDTVFSKQNKNSIEIIKTGLISLVNTIKKMAVQYKDTPIMGRTHGMHAEPITLGLIFLNYYNEFCLHLRRLDQVESRIVFGKASGTVGSCSQISPEYEEDILYEMDLKTNPISNQILSRERYCEVLFCLSLIGATIEKLATQIRHMQRTEIDEVREGFFGGQKGSSAMPHKSNPILSENLCGLSRLLRGYLTTAMENVCLFGERDISHSSSERVIFPDAFCVCDFMIDRANDVLKNLVINEKRMIGNIYYTDDKWKSQMIMLGLIEDGMTRKQAYDLVQRCSFNKNDDGFGFIDLVRKECESIGINFSKIYSKITLDYFFRNIDKIFERTLKTA